jgi:hypothetical protein
LNKEEKEGDFEFRMICPPPDKEKRYSHKDKQTNPYRTKYPIGRVEERFF